VAIFPFVPGPPTVSAHRMTDRSMLDTAPDLPLTSAASSDQVSLAELGKSAYILLSIFGFGSVFGLILMGDGLPGCAGLIFLLSG